MPSLTIARAIALCALVAMAEPAHAQPDANGAGLCLTAAAAAAEQTGVPYDVLRAIAVVETGRNGQPWPWTVAIRGQGHWSDTPSDAAILVQNALDQGITNIDLGCFQVNLHWHSRAFRSVEDMLDPARNAAYAAQFLASKYAETGDWALAAAAYHSATPEYADRYQARFRAAWAGLDTSLPDPNPAPAPAAPPNSFPLFVAGRAASPGSLVPATSAGLRLIGVP